METDRCHTTLSVYDTTMAIWEICWHKYLFEEAGYMSIDI